MSIEGREGEIRVLITDDVSDESVELLRNNGYDVVVSPDLSEDDLTREIPAFDALIMRNATSVTRETINAGENLKVIGCAGIHVDGIDVDAATEAGVLVCNAPTANVISAAELTMSLILSCARMTPQANDSMKSGMWERNKFIGNELYGKTLAIVGLGRVGSLVAERAKAFGMALIGYDPYTSSDTASKLGITMFDQLEDLLSSADFITVHLPKTRETIGMFGAEEFAMMKPTAYVINTARGGIFDVDALAEAVSEGIIAGAGLDVYEKEPCTDSPLHGIDNVILTPHLGASTREAKQRAELQIAQYVIDSLEGVMVPTALNVVQMPEEEIDAISPYVAACETSGRVLAQLATGAITALQVTVCGELPACDLEILGSAVLQGIITQTTNDKVNLVNANYLASQRGIHLYLGMEGKCDDHTNMIRIKGRANGKDVELGCTISGPNNDILLVDFFGYKFDVVPSQNMLVMQYVDGPGRMGKACSILGDAQINISTMQVRDDKGNSDIATVVFTIDEPCTESVREKLASAFELKGIWYVNL